MSMQGVKYSVDVVLCIDATGSMGDIINRVKGNALKFHEDLTERMGKKSKVIDSLRIKVIAFRDFYVDKEKSVMESDFFELPKDKAGFSEFVDTITAEGGGDEPETGLEAVAMAMKSKWTQSADKRRQVIVIWTDASTHQLERDENSKPVHYPADLPKNFDELTDWWEGQDYMSPSAKRLILFAPDAYAWTDISNHWTNVIHHVSKAGNGLEEIDYDQIIDAVANSV